MYRWIDHTAEVELEVQADSEGEVFAEALSALAELLGFVVARAPEPGVRRTVAVSEVAAGDRAALLAGWLEELVFLAESEGFVALAVNDLELSATRLAASVTGVLGDPPPLVKAVTLHRLRFEPRDGGYLARVVLDV